jgi:hypothetical protein
MDSFPMPDFASNLGEFITNALTWVGVINEEHFLDILAAFALAVTIITWAVGRVKNPPQSAGD